VPKVVNPLTKYHAARRIGILSTKFFSMLKKTGIVLE
jgi:hypothetical protein